MTDEIADIIDFLNVDEDAPEDATPTDEEIEEGESPEEPEEDGPRDDEAIP